MVLLIFNEFRSCPLALEVEVRVEVEVQERTTFMADTRSFELETSPGRVTGSTLISVSGPLVLENLFRFQNAWRTDQSPIVIFDLSGVDYMDSSAIPWSTPMFTSRETDARWLSPESANG